MAALLRQSALRYMSNACTPPKSVKGHSPSSHAHEGGYKIWKNLALFIFLPAVAVCMVNCYLEHTKHEEERVEFRPYEHLRRRNKRYPWGNGQKTLFHNSRINPLPDGYEE